MWLIKFNIKNQQAFRLDVYVPPSIENNDDVVEIIAVGGEKITMRCQIKGVPFPNIKWLKSKKKLF